MSGILSRPLAQVFDSVNHKKMITHLPVLGTMQGNGDEGQPGDTWPLLAALTPPLMFPFTEESSSLGSKPILSSTHSGYQLLISAFNHFPNPYKMGPIFQNQNQRSKDNEMKWKNESLRSISYLGRCFLFSMVIFWKTLTGLAHPCPILLVPAGDRKIGSFLLIYFQSWGELCFALTLITKSEGASHFSQGTIIQTMI